MRARPIALYPGDQAEVEARVAEHDGMPASEAGRYRAGVSEIGLVRREERRGLVVAPLTDVDPANDAAREGPAKGVAAPLPPREALGQQPDRAVRFAADGGQQPVPRER